MTATNVMGCGEQRGKTGGYFRAAKVEAAMLPGIPVSGASGIKLAAGNLSRLEAMA